MEPFHKPAEQLSDDDKYTILLATFAAFIMTATGCDQLEAIRRIAAMCAVTQENLAHG